MSSSVISPLLFVIGPGPRPGAEIVDWGRTVLVGFDVDERGGAGGQRLLERSLQFRRIVHGEALRSKRPSKSRWDCPAHGSEICGGDVGARVVGAPVMSGEGAVRLGIDQHDSAAEKRFSQRGDCRGRMDRYGPAVQILCIV